MTSEGEVIHEVIDGEAVLVHLGTGRYHSLPGDEGWPKRA